MINQLKKFGIVKNIFHPDQSLEMKKKLQKKLFAMFVRIKHIQRDLIEFQKLLQLNFNMLSLKDSI